MHGNHKLWQMDSRTDGRMDKHITIVPTIFVGKTTSQVAYYTLLVIDGLSWAIGRNLELTMLSRRLNQAHTPSFIPTALPILISWDIKSLLHEIWLWRSCSTITLPNIRLNTNMDAYMHACIQKHMHYRMITSNIMSMQNCDDTTMKLCYVNIVEDRYYDIS